MAAKTGKKKALALFHWSLKRDFTDFHAKPKTKSKKDAIGYLFILGAGAKDKDLKKELPSGIPSWQEEALKGPSFFGASDEGPVCVVRLKEARVSGQDFGYHDGSSYGHSRDRLGSLVPRLESSKVFSWQIQYLGEDKEEALGALVGLGVGSYRYLDAIAAKKPDNFLSFHLIGFEKSTIEAAKTLALSVNISRHLVNTPANLLNPETYAKEVKELFSGMKGVTVEVWAGARLKKEKMGLMLAVGQASATPSRMVHIKYRPAGAKNKPIAFVGKGITFDSGGLDIKPAASMRLMKKDMGGSASVVGLSYWAIHSKLSLNLDFYLALAENAVDERAFRPGDVLTSRSGVKVEVHNTDAEGRLVLADTLDVAATQKGKNAPSLIVDIATLTGAARVAVGTGIGALFSTKTGDGERVARAGQKRGDHVWPLPLYAGYEKKLKTAFADVNHCAPSGFGGAITAALFLKRFALDVPFVHLDVMGWADKGGVYREAGGNGQVVQCLAGFLESEVAKGG